MPCQGSPGILLFEVVLSISLPGVAPAKVTIARPFHGVTLANPQSMSSPRPACSRNPGIIQVYVYVHLCNAQNQMQHESPVAQGHSVGGENISPHRHSQQRPVGTALS